MFEDKLTELFGHLPVIEEVYELDINSLDYDDEKVWEFGHFCCIDTALFVKIEDYIILLVNGFDD